MMQVGFMRHRRRPGAPGGQAASPSPARPATAATGADDDMAWVAEFMSRQGSGQASTVTRAAESGAGPSRSDGDWVAAALRGPIKPTGPYPRRDRTPLPAPLEGFGEVGSGESWSRTMDLSDPAVAMTRPQSAAGVLGVSLDAGAAAEMFAALHLWNGGQYLLQCGMQDRLNVPIHPGRDRLRIDLHHIRDIRRFAIITHGTNGGNLTLTTTTGARLNIPTTTNGHPTMALTALNADGQLILRAEQDDTHDTPRDTAHAYGYSHSLWRDPRTPL